MTSGEKVALSLLAEICKLKAEQAMITYEQYAIAPLPGQESDEYNAGFFKGVYIASIAFEKRLKELTNGE